jgi:PAS domain S-box-containing protein
MPPVSRTVLLVDDAVEDRELYRRYLQRDSEYSYTIIEAELGQQGLALWHQHRPDIVLLDYRLPDLDGLEFLAQLSAANQFPYLPVIVVTGQGSEAIAVKTMKAGAQDYLVKEHITPEGLQWAVNHTIEAAQLRLQVQQSIERERLISQIIRKVHQTLNLDEILQTTVTEVRQYLKTDRVLIFRLQSSGNGTVVTESVSSEWTPLLSTSYHDPCLSRAYIEPFRQGITTSKSDIHDGSIDPCHLELLDNLQVQANLVVPIRQNDQLWGLLIAHHCTAPRQWQAAEIDLLKDLTTQLGTALKQAELYQQAQTELAERQQAEADLRASEERFRTAVENMLDCFAIYRAVRNDQGHIIDFTAEYINDAACTTSQMTREEHLSRSLCDLLPTHRSSGLFDEYCQVVETGQPLIKENVIYEDQFGQQRLSKVFDIQVAKYGDGYVAAWRDVTQRKRTETNLRESEQLLRLATEGANLGMWYWDLQQGNLVWTDLCKALFGLPAETDMSYAVFLDALHPEDRELAHAAVTRCLQGEGEYNIEYRTLWPDGTVRWIAAKGNCICDDTGQPVRMMGVALDITERKQTEVEREQLLERERSARQDAERANQVKDEFLAILSHELRSPLNPILGWSKLLQTRRFDAAKTAAALATIERNAKLQTQLIDDLLDVARILRGKLKLKTVPLDPVFAIESAIDTVRAAAVAKNILLHPVLPKIGQVSGDNTRLQQIVWNLLSNAIKFTPNRGRVDICLERVDDQARIIVRDTGRGIKPDFLPYLFESFRQEDASTTRRHGGLGLGLAIVRYLVEAHGGDIWAFSEGEGKGATFTVQLPLLNILPEPDPLPNETMDELDLTGVRVLAVDDDPDACDLMSILLTEYGAEVLTLSSAIEVLENFNAFRPDVFVSDIGMPDMDGYMLLQQIRSLCSEGSQIPAIAVTAYAREEDRRHALARGFQHHLAKPLDPEILVSAILELTCH